MEVDVVKELMAINAKSGRAFGLVGKDIRALRKSNSRKNIALVVLGFLVYDLMKKHDALSKEIKALKGEKEM